MSSIRFGCPECGKELASAQPLAKGQKVRCPMCQTVFVPEAGSGSASSIKARKDAPAASRSQSRYEDDDVADDDDYRPRRRRSDDDSDDWDDDRPARIRRKTKSSAPLWIGVGSGVAALLLVFLLMGFVWPGFFRSGASASSGDLLAFLPGNTNAVMGVDLSRQQNNPDWDKLRVALKDLPGAPPEILDLLKGGDRLILGGNLDGIPSGGMIFRSRAPYDVDKIRKLFQVGQPKMVAGKTCYNLNNVLFPGLFLGLADDRTIVFGTSNLEADFARAVGNAKPALSAELIEQIGAIDREEFWAVLLNSGKVKAGLQTIQPQQLAVVPGGADILGPLQKARGFCVWGQRAGEKGAKLFLGATCGSDADAGIVQVKTSDLWKQGGQMLLQMGRGLVEMQPEGKALGGMFDDLSRSFAVDRKGALVYASFELSSKTVQAIEDQQKKLLAGGPVPMNPPPFNPPPFNPPPFNPPPNNPLVQPKGKIIFKTGGILNRLDAKDPVMNQPCKIHTVNLKAGKQYAIDLASTQFDAFLRLELRGQQVALDDDSGGNLNARIIYTAPENGVYRIIATTLNGRTGRYTLHVRELTGP